MNKRFFGTDGIRGRVGDAVMRSDVLLQLGFAIGTVIARIKTHPTVLIGRDTRISGTALQSALQAGLLSAGVNVTTLGVMPTPGVAYLTRALRAEAGIVISASHNAYEDNGIKLFNAEGMKFSDAEELAIEALMDAPLQMQPAKNLGVMHRLQDAATRYADFCRHVFPKTVTLSGLKIVVDAANGACFEIAPAVFRGLGAEVIGIAAEPNGTNINAGCGATDTRALQAAVVFHQADLGIALDGDGDRLLLVDHTGALVDGDQILGILARDALTQPNGVDGVVGTVMSNLGLEQALSQLSIAFERTKVGDRYVLERLVEKGWSLGGEASGHIVNLAHTTTGDGIITALEVLRILCIQNTRLADLSRVMIKRPQVLINVPHQGDIDLNDAEIVAATTAAETQLSDQGRLLIRASGTEPLIRVMVEGNVAAEVQQLAEHIADVIRASRAAS